MDDVLNSDAPEHPQGTSVAEAAAAIEKRWADAEEAAEKGDTGDESGSEEQDDNAEEGGDTDVSPDADDSEQDENDDADPDTGGGDDDSGDSGAGDEGSESPISTLAELAEATEVPVEEILSGITHKVGEADVPLADLVSSYTGKAALDQGYQSLALERQTHTEAYQKQSTLMAHSMQAMEKLLSADLETAEMQALRTTDPGEWNARMTEIGQKVGALRGFHEKLSEAYDTHIKEERAKFFESEGQRLKAQIPGWGAEKLRTSIGVMREMGFSDEEVANIADSRLLKTALQFHDLKAENKALKEAAAKAQAAARKVKKTVPKKTLKPNAGNDGGKAKGQGIDRKNVVSLRRRLAKSNKVEDAAKVIEAMMT